jgi:carbamoylphosphate synthase large subunit
VIGQTAEFDCAGTQACKSLHKEDVPEIFFDYYKGCVEGLAE